ncbi:DNA mismatch repair endonuclease MutL [Paenibacillus sp. y28]|uniref:DNA mismatch repair endonuclease MutL n=1 Tax=Paenibacillus sp. y28 TaxID=3129110 RepID=UPI003017CB46
MGKIHVLSDHIANQIAAGEVVERPSSVVKELVENSVDAGSTRIDVAVEEGGLQLVRVTDNGSGMEPEDSELAFSRHATSKIATGKDLFQIRSLGFRGEALPSIAAVSKVHLLTSSREDGLGCRIEMEGGKLMVSEEAAASRGTDIQVKELFFNTPARLKYMKTIQTELGHISDYMYRLSLAHPEISFSLKHNGHLLFQTLGNGDLLQVIAAIYGTASAKAMTQVQGNSPDYAVSGYVSRPELTRANRFAVSTFVNGRYIRNYALVQAIMAAYHTLLPINRYPLAVLQLQMDPALVDVNVHPSKLEVRFSKEPELLELVQQSVRSVLQGQILIPLAAPKAPPRSTAIQEQIRFGRPGETIAAPEVQDQRGGDWQGGGRGSPGSNGPLPQLGQYRSASAGSGESLPEERYPANPGSSPAPSLASKADGVYAAEGSGSRTAESAIRENTAAYSRSEGGSRSSAAYPEPRERKPAGQPYLTEQQLREMGNPKLPAASGGDPGPLIPPFPQLYPIGQLHGTYIVAQNEDGMYLIDQHAAHERINYELFYEKFGQPQEASQELLLPLTLEFTPSEASVIKDKMPLFEQVGVILEEFGGSSFLVRAYPHWLPSGEEKDIIEEIAEWILQERKAVDLRKLREKSSILCSCKASIKANQQISLLEMEVLFDKLAACGNPYTCPHGRPIVVSFSTYELEKMFKRVM